MPPPRRSSAREVSRPSRCCDCCRPLAGEGADLRYHGDFDWPGIAIANRVLRRTGARPWRFSAGDYLRAEHRGAAPLRGEPLDACWDPALRPAMERAGVAIEEERVAEDLVADLRGQPPPG